MIERARYLANIIAFTRETTSSRWTETVQLKESEITIIQIGHSLNSIILCGWSSRPRFFFIYLPTNEFKEMFWACGCSCLCVPDSMRFIGNGLEKHHCGWVLCGSIKMMLNWDFIGLKIAASKCFRSFETTLIHLVQLNSYCRTLNPVFSSCKQRPIISEFLQVDGRTMSLYPWLFHQNEQPRVNESLRFSCW